MFLMEMTRIDGQLHEVGEKCGIAEAQLHESKDSYEQVKTEYERMESEIEQLEQAIGEVRENLSGSTVLKGKLEGQINVLKEQIHTAEMTDEHLKDRLDSIEKDTQDRLAQKDVYGREREELLEALAGISERKQAAEKELDELRNGMKECSDGIEHGKSEIIELLNNKASVKARQQRFDTMAEQINIRKAKLTQRLLARKTEEEDLDNVLAAYQQELDDVNETIRELKESAAAMEEKNREWRRKYSQTSQQLEQDVTRYHKEQSRLETLKNIAERYDGYGNSIRRVMEQKDRHKGILGVVSDLIQVEKKYEVAIETALGGSIQNIVTDNEETAKRMIAFLKKNKFGAYINGIWMVVILSGSIILAQVLVPNADTVLRQLTQLNSVTMPMRYLWVFFAYFMLRKHTNKFEREYRFVKNNGVALGFGAWCFFVTAACCILGMYKQGDMYTTVLNVITPIVLVTLGLILPAIKKREGKSA